MKLGRIDSVSPNGLSSIDDDDDESSTISFHVSTKYTYTLTFSTTITSSRSNGGEKLSMSYGKRIQLDALYDPRQAMSTVQSLEIQLTPVLHNGQEIVNQILLKIYLYCLF